MILRRITYKITKWLTLLFCLFTILLTTPFGSQLTLSLLNNIDGINADYRAGSIVRDLELNSFHLNLTTIDIKITDLTADINFSCSWRKTLCLNALKVGHFSLDYANNEQEKKSKDKTSKNIDSLFVMPFAIEAKTVEFTKSLITINQTLIAIEKLTAQVDIKASQFSILAPNANKLTIALEKNTHDKQVSTALAKSKNSQEKPNIEEVANSIHLAFNKLPEVYLPLSLNIQQLFVKQIGIIEHQEKTTTALKSKALASDVQWPYQQNHLSGTWLKSDVNITDFKTSTADYDIKQSTLITKLIPPYNINAQLDAQLHKIPHWPQAADSRLDLSLQGSFDNLSATVNSKGSVILNSRAHINLTNQQLPFTLQISADKLPLPLSLAHYGRASTLSLELAGNLLEQKLSLTSRVNSYGYKNALLNLSAKHQQGLISLNKLTFNEQDSNSQLGIHGNIDFQSRLTSWQLFIDSTGFTLPNIKLKPTVSPETTASTVSSNDGSSKAQSQDQIIKNILPEFVNGRVLGKIATTGIWSQSQWSVSINETAVSGTINNSPLIINGDIALDHSGHFSSGDLAQGELLIAFDKDQLSLHTFNDENWHVNGQLTITDINRWYAPANGAIDSNFTITGNKTDPLISLSSKISQLNWQQFYSPSVDISASYQPFNNHKTQLTVQSGQLKVNDKSTDLNIEDIMLNFRGDLNQHEFKLDWQGDLAGKLRLSGLWFERLNLWQSTIEQAAITYNKETWRTNDIFALSVNSDKQQLLIEPHCWLGTGVDLCLTDETIIGESGKLKLGLNVDLSLIDVLLLPEEVQLQSKVTGEIQAQWSPTQAISAQAMFALSSGNITVNDEYNEQQVSQWRQGELSFTVNEQQLASKFQLQDLEEKPLINIDSTINFIDDLPIDAKIELNQFNLQPFQALISKVVNLQGQVTSALTIKGSIKKPLINGIVALESGELLLSQNPNKLENISAQLQINDNQASMLGDFFIKDNKATINGQLAWQDNFTMDIDLNAKQLPLVFPPQLVVNISPKLNFTVSDKVLTITGNLAVLEGNYNIEKLPQDSINLSDDVIIIDAQGKEVFKENSGLAIETNISINIAKAFKVSGQGLESQLFGQLQVTQQQKQPLQLFGNIQSINGSYQAYGQKLTIEKGELTFNGPLTNPYFNLRASRHIKAEDIEVGLQITGLADSLDMQLFSTPTMEAPEMLSYLARGRGLDSGSDNSTAAASMLIGFGVTNSVGLFDQVEKLPLISNIAVDTEGEADTTQATISGYIGERIYVKYGIGVYEPINELTVRLYLLNRLWLEVVSGIEQSSDLYYSFDID